MWVLVTGGAGFIGSALAAALLDRGDDVVVLDNLMGGDSAKVPDGARFVAGDVRDPDLLSDVCRGAEVVFHLAAVRSVPRSLDEPFLVHECNASGTLNVLLAAEAAGARRVVYASSSSIYGGAEGGMSREDAAPRPPSPYAVSKLAGDHYCRVWAGLGRLTTVSLRYFNVFGPGQAAESKYAAVFPAFIASLAQGRAPEIHWDGEQSRDFTYIDDVVRANLMAAGAGPKANGAVINIAGGDPKTVNDAFAAVSAALGVEIEPRRAARREGDIRHSHADISRAHDLLGWEPRADWHEAVKATVAWFTAGGS